MNQSNIDDIILREINQASLKSLIESICSHQRVRGMPGLEDSMKMLQDWFSDISGASVQLRRYKTDTKTRYGTWPPPVSWVIQQASLQWSMHNSSKQVQAVHLKNCNLGVYSYSGKVAPEQEFVVISEEMISGSNTESSQADLPSINPWKTIVFFRNFDNQKISRLLHKSGYRGVITAPDSQLYKNDEIMKNARHWHRIPMSGTEDFLKPDSCHFGFSLSPEEGDLLEEHLSKSHKRNAHATVQVHLDSQFPNLDLPVLEVIIHGNQPCNKYIIVTSHICHPKPSANDNASGVTTAAHIAQFISRQIHKFNNQTGIVFLFVPENIGTLAWLLNPPMPVESIIAGLNFDMTGADPGKAGSHLHLIAPPPLYKNFLSDLCCDALIQAEKLVLENNPEIESTIPVKTYPFSIGSDNHILNFPDFRIPSIAFICWPDRFYHSDADTPEQINYSVLQQITIAGAISLMSLLRSVETVSGSKAINIPEPADKNTFEINSYNQDLLKLVPVRNYIGPIYRTAVYESTSGKESSVLESLSGSRDYAGLTMLALAEMLIDGNRSVEKIISIMNSWVSSVSAKLKISFDTDQFIHWLKDLSKHGYVEWR